MENADLDTNYLVKIVAKDRGISEPSAWSLLKNNWTPNSQLAGFLQKTDTNPQLNTTLIESKQSVSLEKLRQDFEIKKMELDEKKDAREQCKIELAEKKLEIEKEIALARIQLEKDINASRIEMEQKRLAQKEEFDQKLLLIQANKSGSGDLFEQMTNVHKLEQTVGDKMIARAEALGVDAATLKKITGSSKSEGINFNKLIDLADSFVKKAQKEQELIQNTPSGLEKQPPQQPPASPLLQQSSPISPEVEMRIRAEIEIKAHELKMEAEKKFLEAQLIEERKKAAFWEKERLKLELRAKELGIEYDSTTTPEQLFYWIEHQEAIIGQQQKDARVVFVSETAERKELETQRHTLISRALDLGIPFDATITNEELETLIDKHQAVLDEFQGQEPEKQVYVDTLAVPAAAQKVKKPQRKEKVSKKAIKERINFEIHDMAGSLIQEIDAKSHRSAALLIAKELNGTHEAPVRVRITDSNDDEKIFDTWLNERKGKKGIVFQPIVKIVKKPTAIEPETSPPTEANNEAESESAFAEKIQPEEEKEEGLE